LSNVNELHLKLLTLSNYINGCVAICLFLQLNDQVEKINSKLQASLSTLSKQQQQQQQQQESASAIINDEAAATSSHRAKIDKMSAEVVDSNPYSRLMALQRMGIVKDYERIRTRTVSPADGLRSDQSMPSR